MPTFAEITAYKTAAIRDAIEHLERTRRNCMADGHDWKPSLGEVIAELKAYSNQANQPMPEPDDSDDEDFDLMTWGV